MRAFSVLKALSKKHRIHLADADIFRGNRKSSVDPEVQHLCEAVFHIRLPFFRKLYARMLRFIHEHAPCLFSRMVSKPVDYFCASLITRKALGPVLNKNYDKIFVFRLYLYPIAKLVKKDAPDSVVFLDQDEIESITRSRIADLRRKNGDLCTSVSLATEAAFFKRLEEDIVPGCKRVFVASESDRKKMQQRTGARNLSLLPNVYAPRTLAGKRSGNLEFTFLFIGSYAYYPNHDAAVVLCRDVIPRLNEISPVPFSFRFVGTGAGRSLRNVIQSTNGAVLIGPVENVETVYSGIDAMAAPINAGGGTRIKILEAFAFGKPVVSTSMGAEGIECEDGVHLLLANTVEVFADQCLRLIESRPLRESLTRAATELLQQKYHPELLSRQILDA